MTAAFAFNHQTGDYDVVEKVLVFHAEALKGLADYDRDGRSLIVKTARVASFMLDHIFRSGRTMYMERPAAEVDPTYKQLIPYCVLTKPGSYFVYRRTKKGGESRLHDLWSIGVGGHINPVDGGNSDRTAYDIALLRELSEEVGLLFKSADHVLSPRGVIYDPTNEVGKVHLGVVHLVGLPHDAQVRSNDPALSNGFWFDKETLLRSLPRFERWSQLVIQNLL